MEPQDKLIAKSPMKSSAQGDERERGGFPCDLKTIFSVTGFLGSSAGKESVCNAGDPGLIPRLGRSAGEGLGYPL